MSIDWPRLINWIAESSISFAFGALGAWIAYQWQRKHDQAKWREQLQAQKQQFEAQKKHDWEMLREQERHAIQNKQLDDLRETLRGR